MPALFAHPAAAIPFRRVGLSLSALIIGSMTPDVLYFFHLSKNPQFGHTLPGLFLFCLPVGGVLLGAFHLILKYPLFSLLPDQHQTRLLPVVPKVPFPSTKRSWLLLIFSLLLGACTHIVWDSCTHVYGWTVRHVFLLYLPLLTTSYGTLRVYKVLQHGGTIGGTCLLILWYWRWFQKAPMQPVPTLFERTQFSRIGIFLLMGGIACLSGVVYGRYKVPGLYDVQSFSLFVVFSFKAGFLSLLLVLFGFSIGWHVKHHGGYSKETSHPGMG